MKEDIIPSPPSEYQSKRKRPALSIVNLLALTAVLGLLVVPIVSSYLRGQAQGRFSICSKSCLHGMGVALNMYAKDFGGHYPKNLSQLTPNYIRQLPICPENETSYEDCYMTGAVGNNEDGQLDDYFILFCKKGHASLDGAPGYPQYDSESGLFER